MRVFKIVDEVSWHSAGAAGRFDGAPIDLKDGYIHLSGESQVEETARLHFGGRAGLLLVAFDEVALGPALKWEASRGGQLFPHLYGTLDPSLALWAKPLPWDGSAHVFPKGWRA